MENLLPLYTNLSDGTSLGFAAKFYQALVYGDIDKAMTEGWSTATNEVRNMGFGAGMGLPNMKRNADGFDIVSAVGTGTDITMTFDI